MPSVVLAHSLYTLLYPQDFEITRPQRTGHLLRFVRVHRLVQALASKTKRFSYSRALVLDRQSVAALQRPRSQILAFCVAAWRNKTALRKIRNDPPVRSARPDL